MSHRLSLMMSSSSIRSLVDDLGGGVQLGVVPRDGLDDLGRTQQRTLLSVEELTEGPFAVLDAVVEPLLLTPVANDGAVVQVGIDTRRDGDLGLVGSDLLLDVDVDRPVEVGGGVPLAGLGLLVQLAEVRTLQAPVRWWVLVVGDAVVFVDPMCFEEDVATAWEQPIQRGPGHAAVLGDVVDRDLRDAPTRAAGLHRIEDTDLGCRPLTYGRPIHR
jgi:hypothetical protein